MQQQEECDFQILDQLSPSEIKELQEENFKRVKQFYEDTKHYEIQYWYQGLKQFTFESFSFPLTIHEAYTLHSKYYEQYMNQKDLNVLQELIKKVDLQIAKHKQEENQIFFMKLSSRSPKDYCWDYRKEGQVQKYGQKLLHFLSQNKVTKQTQKNILFNLLYKFFLIQSKDKLGICSGTEFFQIFSASERIIGDINDFSLLLDNAFGKIKKQEYENSNDKMINVWIRKWNKCEWHEEFRVFYNHYSPTAISQYDQKCYFEELQNKEDILKEKVLIFFNEIKPILQKLQLQNGVMDLVINNEEIKLIQINVFNANARASLFSWVQDKQILQNGPLTVRLLKQIKQISKEELSSMMGMIDKKTADVIMHALSQLQIQWSS